MGDTSRDEEIARALQMEEDAQAAAAVGEAEAHAGSAVGGSAAAAPARADEPVEIILNSGEESAAQEPGMFEKLFAYVREFTANFAPGVTTDQSWFIACVSTLFVLVWWIFSVAKRGNIFFLAFSAIFCPVGFYGLVTKRPAFISAYLYHLFVLIGLDVISPFVASYSLPFMGCLMLLCVIVCEVLAAAFTWKYRKALTDSLPAVPTLV